MEPDNNNSDSSLSIPISSLPVCHSPASFIWGSGTTIIDALVVSNFFRRDPLEQLVEIVERVAVGRIVQRPEIRRQGTRINPYGIRRGKIGRLEKKVVTGIVEVAEDSPLAPVAVHRFSKIEFSSSISISFRSACSPFVIVFVSACSMARSDR
jgi:hypothetical protein